MSQSHELLCQVERALDDYISKAESAEGSDGAGLVILLDPPVTDAAQYARQVLGSVSGLDDESHRSIIAKLTAWLREGERQAEDSSRAAEEFLTWWIRNLEKNENAATVTLCALLIMRKSEPAILLQRIERTIGGLCDFLTAELPDNLRQAREAHLLIDWTDRQGKVSWRAGTGNLERTLFEIAQDSADLLGEFEGELADSIADSLCSALRRGEVKLPVFRYHAECVDDRTVLEWLAPSNQIPVADESSAEAPIEWEEFGAELAEVCLRAAAPQLAKLSPKLDQAMNLARHSKFSSETLSSFLTLCGGLRMIGDPKLAEDEGAALVAEYGEFSLPDATLLSAVHKVINKETVE